MIDQITTMLREAGASRMTLTITPEGDSNVTVIAAYSGLLEHRFWST
ncbi:hypothetical protein [Kistimonas scapharcae]